MAVGLPAIDPADSLSQFRWFVADIRTILQDGQHAADLTSALATIRRAEAGLGILGILVDRL